MSHRMTGQTWAAPRMEGEEVDAVGIHLFTVDHAGTGTS
jgi:hypothetical protein